MPENTSKAVILARGLGTRMRKSDENAHLAPQQSAVADAGVKALIPVGANGRPFVDYLLSSLADAGFSDVCLVIGPEHDALRNRYENESVPSRIQVHFAVQEKALGTADAVLSAEPFARDEPFVVINSDNYYPLEALRALHNLAESAIAGFDRDALIRFGNVPPERTARFGALDINEDGYLRRILVSPTAEMIEAGPPIYCSMNCFLFTSEIFRACREVPISKRGEYELPQAIHLAIDRGWMRFKVVKVSEPVLDMSTRGDITRVAEHLSSIDVRL